MQNAIEQAVVERLRIARRQIGSARGADEQRVAGEQAILHLEAHRITRVPGCMDRLDAQLPEDDGFTVAHSKVDERLRRRYVSSVHGRDSALSGLERATGIEPA